MIEENGFTIEALKLIVMDEERAHKFYDIHSKRPFFEKLTEFMTSGKTVAVILEKDDAVVNLRKLVGNTNPQKAFVGTIRYLYGKTITKNAVHASDSPENANIEIGIMFPEYQGQLNIINSKEN